MKKKLFKRVSALALAGLLGVGMMSQLAYADNEPTTGSLTIYKYDITAAKSAGIDTSTYTSTGSQNTAAEEALAAYSLEGVEFTYLWLGESETADINGETQTVYEIPTDLADIIGLTENDAVTVSTCDNKSVYHYTSTQINQVMQDADKDNLEKYIGQAKDAKEMTLTDENGLTTATDLDLGVYLIVETAVPENVTSTVSPWIVSIPYAYTDSNGNTAETYNVYCYPKNESGIPDVDKSVKSDESDATYGDTATASEGDTVSYIVVSHLPAITSASTYLSEYTFVDTLSKGLTYDENLNIAVYDNEADADANNLDNKIENWTPKDSNPYFTVDYATDPDTKVSTMTVKMTEAGLQHINTSLSEKYIVLYYTTTLNSDATVVLGDDGNPNDVTLTWSRTSDEFKNTLEDENIVYAYALKVTKTFSDKTDETAANFSKVKFTLQNATDNYYVVADGSKGVYYMTGTTANADDATEFTLGSDGTFVINGLEGDSYVLAETATVSGYALIADTSIVINEADRDIIASVAGVTGLKDADADTAEKIIDSYNGGLINENGQYVDETIDELTGNTAKTSSTDLTTTNTTGKTDMYVGTLQPSSATVNGEKADLDNGVVTVSIVNSKNFTLPKTGGNGLYLLTILGVIVAAGGIYMVTRKRDRAA